MIMELTKEDIQKYIELGNKIDTIVRRYYNKNIYCEYCDYEFIDWVLRDTNTIRILYSFVDYNDNRVCDDRTLTLEELNLNQ